MVFKKMYYLFTILMSIVWTKALAYDIAVKNADGVVINYNFIKNGTELEVTKGYYKDTVVIPEEITYKEKARKVSSIGEEAFLYCYSLTSIIIPQSVTCIGREAFSGCSGLTYITIPNSVTKIERFAFSGCSGLTSITIGKGLQSIESLFLRGCTALTSITIEAGNTKYDSRDNCNGIIETKTNTLLYGCQNTTIPTSVTKIERFAFSGCSGLTSITIPNSVTSIGDGAFRDCIGLTSVTIGSGVTSIGSSAFHGCSGLTSVTIPNSVTSIDRGAFFGCTALTSITIEAGNTKYDSRDNCNGIIETKTNTLLYGCQNTTIPTSVTKIEHFAFSGCSGLTSITIPNSVTSIGGGAFSGCKALTSITIEAGNTKYDSRDNCNGIIETKTNTLLYGCQNTTIPTSVTSIGIGAFDGCSGLTSITIPNSVTSIGSRAFWGCSGLTSITIPNSVKSIEMGAFIGCSGLTSITIGNNVRSIDFTAFAGCHISEIISKVEKPFDIEKNMFNDNTYSNAILYVPVGTIKRYKATEGWMNFQNIKEGLPSGNIDNGSKSK